MIAASPETSFIRFQKVRKAFGQKIVYASLNLEIRRGEVLTICGGSGVGKSVALKMLIGLLKADYGSIVFDGLEIETGYRADLVVEGRVLVELKAVERVLPLHEAQILTYLKVSRIHVGFLINFNVPRLQLGLRRYVR